MSYAEFIARKRMQVATYGFDATVINPHLKDWQARIVKWAVKRGRAALFEGTGLGKTLQQLVWCENVVKHAGPVLLICPLGVRLQTKEESAKFGIGCDVRLVQDQSECGPGVNITNYDRIEKFTANQFAGVCLDESAILKGLTSKTRKTLCEMFSNTNYRLACTATPSPNDHTELGNHAEFLGVMKSVDMQTRFFYHDSGDTASWILMPHAEKSFWEWVASWAVCIGMPSDIGGDDDGYVLPELNTYRHFVEIPELALTDGMLFNVGRTISATNIHQEKRLSVEFRIEKALDVIRNEPDRKCVVWCDSNQEQDMLEDSLGELCVSIQGSDSAENKERMEREWRCGDVPVLLTKGSIFGAGMNWQHCSKMVFVGLTYSFEQYYQSIRRCWRFGQQNEVDVQLIIAETESAMQSAIARKESDFESMRSGMAEAMRSRTLEEFGLDNRRIEVVPTNTMTVPEWLK
jgi:superfamily II DNA or RNA helicase